MKLTLLDRNAAIVFTGEVTGSQGHLPAIESVKCHIYYGCRVGRCGACIVKIDEPSAVFSPSDCEKKTLAAMAAKDGERLACVLELDHEFSGSLTMWNAFSVNKPVTK